MATISIRVDDDTRDQLEAHARARDTTLSELMRQAIDAVLERDPEQPWKRSDVPQTLSTMERRQLAFQHELIAHVSDDPAEKEYALQRSRVLRRGYTLEYGAEFDDIEPELSRADCRLVYDILDMFRMLEVSLERLEPAARDELGEGASMALSFGGFDFNNAREAHMADYVDYLVSAERWAEQRDFLRRTGGGNSHSPMLPRYERMLETFRPIRNRKAHGKGWSLDGLLLSVDELREVLEARFTGGSGFWRI